MSSENEMLKILLAVANHAGGFLELSAADLRAPAQGEGVLIERGEGTLTIRKISKSSEIHWLGKAVPERVESARSPAAEDDNIPTMVDDFTLAQAEEAFRTRGGRRQ